MSYIYGKVLWRMLKCQGVTTIRICCVSSFCRDYSFPCVPNSLAKSSMKSQMVLKNKYITALQRHDGKRKLSFHSNFDFCFLSTRVPHLCTSVRFMAGHSKWQNIKHIKAAKDAEKSKIFQKYSIMIKKAVIDGGPNPRNNSKLANLLEEAKRCNMPNSSIERSIKRAKETQSQTSMMEIQGPGGCFLVVEIETDNKARTVHDIKLLCRRLGGVILPEGRTRPIFDCKGVIVVNGMKDNSPLDCTKAMDVAIEAGAEDVQEVESDDKETSIQFLCDPIDFNKVKKYIESTDYIIDDANVKYIPKDSAKVTLSDDKVLDAAGNLCDSLEELPEVVTIYDNIQ